MKLTLTLSMTGPYEVPGTAAANVSTVLVPEAVNWKLCTSNTCVVKAETPEYAGANAADRDPP